ncbi:MAG: TetR family transcriptional regulator [Sphingobacteriia bacterium]|nr:TetR family transcriptional regulator [Sphingobacteriia bacterium]
MARQASDPARQGNALEEGAAPAPTPRHPRSQDQSTGPFKNAAKREAIIDASAALFVRQGVERTSLTQIAKAAGVAKQTIYSHFENKDALFAAGLPRAFARHGLDLEEITAGDDAGEILRRLLRAYLAVVLDPQIIAMNRVVMAEATQYPDVARRCWEQGPARSRTLFIAVVARLVERGLLQVDDVEQAGAELRMLAATEFRERLLLNLTDAIPQAEVSAHIEQLVFGFLLRHSLSKARQAVTDN